MSFLKIRQATLTGERKAYVSTSAIAYIQELIPDQDITWQVGVEPSRALIFLHQKLDPIISLDLPEDIVKQATANIPGTQIPEQKLPKKSK
jgi:hypothetical protein